MWVLSPKEILKCWFVFFFLLNSPKNNTFCNIEEEQIMIY